MTDTPVRPAPRASGRRSLVLGLAALCCGLGKSLQAATPTDLPLSESLVDELKAALQAHLPLVVLVSLEGCPHCELARNAHLAPLRRRGQPVVQVDWRSPRRLQDFSGAAHTHDAMVRQWRILVAPTVLFFGADGREIAPRLAGGVLPDFYGAYLEARLETARKNLRA